MTTSIGSAVLLPSPLTAAVVRERNRLSLWMIKQNVNLPRPPRSIGACGPIRTCSPQVTQRLRHDRLLTDTPGPRS
jgi:hypothetical protein